MYKQSDLSDESMLSSRNDLSDESMLCNQNSLSDKELLIVHYGVADKAGRRQSLNAIADVLKMIFPDYEVQQAFSSQRVIDRIKNQEGVDIKSVKMALDEAASNHVRSLVVLPTYIISGIEYHSLLEIVHAYEEKFVSIKMCKPMLTEKDDFNITADAIAAYASCYDDEQTAICLMGHGTTDAANEAYLRLQSTFNDKNYVNYYVGTKCASPMAKDILCLLKAKDYKRVVLMPLMISVGRHARTDMAGDQPSSWKCIFEAEGYEVICDLKGIGELPEIQNLFAEHVRLVVGNENDN